MTRQIIAMIVAERLRLKRATAKRLIKSITRLLTVLQKELSDLESGIDEAIKSSPIWKAKEDLLASLGTLDRRQIAALVWGQPVTSSAPVSSIASAAIAMLRLRAVWS